MNKILQGYFNSLYPHQQQAAKAMKVSTVGQVLLPTGTGKTRVQVYSMLAELDALKGTPGIVLMAAHRLLLCEQLLKELLTLAFQAGMKFNVLTIASDGMDLQDVARIQDFNGALLQHCLVEKTTSSNEIKDFVKKTADLGRHLLVVSTYQSIDRVLGVPVNLACMDEAHTITEQNKFMKVSAARASFKKTFFFTATAVHLDGGNLRGMQNVGFYGQILNKMSPREAIDAGYILPPVLHTLKWKKGSKPSNVTAVKAAWKEHRLKVLEVAANKNPDGSYKMGAKLLISAAGIEEIVSWATGAKFFTWALNSGVQVITFTSGFGYYVNGREVQRKEALDTLMALKDEDSAIIMHYDILTEGIDLPNLTGVMPLRELDTVKLKQTCGRAARLFGIDRTNIANKKAKKTKIVSNVVVTSPDLVKPNFWVIVSPTLDKESQQAESQQVKLLREAYELTPAFRNVPEVSTSSSTEEADSVIPPTKKTPAELKHTAEYDHEIEALVFGGLSPQDQDDMINKILDSMEVPSGTKKVVKCKAATPVPKSVQGRAQAGGPRSSIEASLFDNIRCLG